MSGDIIEANIAFYKSILAQRRVSVPESLPPGFPGEIAAGDRMITITLVNYYSVAMETVHEVVEPPIRLEPNTFACAPGGEEIGLYDEERRLMSGYRRGEDGVWRPVHPNPTPDDAVLPAHIIEALSVLCREGPRHGITVEGHTSRQGESTWKVSR
jgi:hypothetical protein